LGRHFEGGPPLPCANFDDAAGAVFGDEFAESRRIGPPTGCVIGEAAPIEIFVWIHAMEQRADPAVVVAIRDIDTLGAAQPPQAESATIGQVLEQTLDASGEMHGEDGDASVVFEKIKLPPLVDCPDFQNKTNRKKNRDDGERSAHAKHRGGRIMEEPGDCSRNNELKVGKIFNRGA